MRPFHFYLAGGVLALVTALVALLAPHTYLLGILVGVVGFLALVLVAGGVVRARLEEQTADLQEQMSALLEGGDLSALMGGLGGFGPLGQADAPTVTPAAAPAQERARRILDAEDRPIFRSGSTDASA